MEKSVCTIKGCPFEGRYCRLHQEISMKADTVIKKFSEKREKINRSQYTPAAKKYVKEHPVCEVNMEGCTKKAVCVHHVVGRSTIKELLDQKNWKSACVNCNNRVETHTAEAIKKEVKKSKHKDFKREK